MRKNSFFVLGMLALTLTFGLVLAGCDNGSTNTGGATVDGLAYTATETRVVGGGNGKVYLYLLSDSYETALASLTAQFGTPAGGVINGSSNADTSLASNAPDGAVLYVVETNSTKTTTYRYLAKKESGSWDTCVTWG